jgi:hypothetical protein
LGAWLARIPPQRILLLLAIIIGAGVLGALYLYEEPPIAVDSAALTQQVRVRDGAVRFRLPAGWTAVADEDPALFYASNTAGPGPESLPGAAGEVMVTLELVTSDRPPSTTMGFAGVESFEYLTLGNTPATLTAVIAEDLYLGWVLRQLDPEHLLSLRYIVQPGSAADVQPVVLAIAGSFDYLP